MEEELNVEPEANICAREKERESYRLPNVCNAHALISVVNLTCVSR